MSVECVQLDAMRELLCVNHELLIVFFHHNEGAFLESFKNAYTCAWPVHQFYRKYEEKQLKAQQQRAKKRLEFTNQESRLQNQVDRGILLGRFCCSQGHLPAGAYDSFKNENHNGAVHNPSHSWTPANFPILSLLLFVSARSVSGGRVFYSSLDEHSNSSCRLPPSPSALTLTLCQYGRSYTWLARSSRALAWCSRVSTDLRYITIMTSFCFPFSVGLWKIKGQKRYNFRVECVLSIPSSWASYCTLSRLVLISAMTASSLVAKKQQTEYLPSMHFTITYICGRCVCACRSW